MEKNPATTSNRLISLDVFRGMTIAAMILVNFPGSWKVGYEPLEHAAWEGTTPADYIFPFFIFIDGISITLSFTKLLNEGLPKGQIVQKILWRTLKIFAIGVALKILPTFDFSRIELPGVLQRIALVFFACALLFVYTDWKTQIGIGVAILILYCLTMYYIPVPNFGAGILEPGKNLANWFDGIVIPANLLNKKGYDSEGFYSTFPAIVSGISGLLAGKILLTNNNTERKVILFFVIGSILVLCGTSWGYTFPIVKKIWTSSYVLLTSGWAFLCLALFIWLIDLNKFTTGTKPFIIFGSNAIAIYVLADVFETFFIKTNLRDNVFSGMVNWGIYDKTVSLIWAFFSVLVCYLAAHLLYSRKIFIKL